MNRRQFLGQASFASFGAVGAMSSMVGLRMTEAFAEEAADADDGYKALVCVFLAGGNDSFNMLLPASGAGYAEYVSSRAALARVEDDILPLSTPLPDGRTIGVAKELVEIRDLYEAGNAAFIANVGTLVEPVTLSAINDGSAKLPLGLFSHFDQQLHWQSGLPDQRFPGKGWGARLTDTLADLETGGDRIPAGVSLSGLNRFQGGAADGLFSKQVGEIPGIKNWDAPSLAAERGSIETVLEASQADVFQRVFAQRTTNALETSAIYRTALEGSSLPPEATFSASNSLSMKLKDVAETIAASDQLGNKRQTFYVQVSGWDTHGSLETHPGLMAQVSQACGEFYAALEALGRTDEVTLFTASDFGRTLSANGGEGSDHAWGGNQIVMGGAVNGRKIYGDYPTLALGSTLDTGRGRLIPTTSVDEYIAELALWMGVEGDALNMVVPNLSRFYSPSSGTPPLGMFTTQGA